MTTQRMQKVTALLRRELSQLISIDFSEAYGLITVSDINITADFKDAKVFITVLDQDREKDILQKLSQKAYQYQRALGHKLKMKFTPRLKFILDHGQEKIDKIDELLKEIDHGT